MEKKHEERRRILGNIEKLCVWRDDKEQSERDF